MLFASKQKKIESQLAMYREKVSQCLGDFHESFKQYCEDSDRDKLQQNFLDVHKTESQADDIRREIEVMMYSKAIFPESRGDILGLLEALDKVPNQVEAILNMVFTHNITVPAHITGRILRLVDICHRCVDALLEASGKLFSDFTNATVAIGKVDELESEADQLEFNLYEQIFADEIDGIDKILLRDLVKSIAAISDRAENAGDRIRIIVAKRSL